MGRVSLFCKLGIVARGGGAGREFYIVTFFFLKEEEKLGDFGL